MFLRLSGFCGEISIFHEAPSRVMSPKEVCALMQQARLRRSQRSDGDLIPSGSSDLRAPPEHHPEFDSLKSAAFAQEESDLEASSRPDDDPESTPSTRLPARRRHLAARLASCAASGSEAFARCAFKEKSDRATEFCKSSVYRATGRTDLRKREETRNKALAPRPPPSRSLAAANVRCCLRNPTLQSRHRQPRCRRAESRRRLRLPRIRSLGGARARTGSHRLHFPGVRLRFETADSDCPRQRSHLRARRCSAEGLAAAALFNHLATAAALVPRSIADVIDIKKSNCC